MCSSHRRRRDRTFPGFLAELEAPIARLTSRGARAIVVAGMSQGGLGAIVFGARRSGLAGVIALAPNGAPERLVNLFPQISESVARARAMVAERRGDERASFTDLNVRGPFSIETTQGRSLRLVSIVLPALQTCSTTSTGCARRSCRFWAPAAGRESDWSMRFKEAPADPIEPLHYCRRRPSRDAYRLPGKLVLAPFRGCRMTASHLGRSGAAQPRCFIRWQRRGANRLNSSCSSLGDVAASATGADCLVFCHNTIFMCQKILSKTTNDCVSS